MTWLSSGTTCSSPRHHTIVGTGVPETTQLNSTVSVGLAALGLIGTTNVGAIPVSYFSVNSISLNIFLNTNGRYKAKRNCLVIIPNANVEYFNILHYTLSTNTKL